MRSFRNTSENVVHEINKILSPCENDKIINPFQTGKTGPYSNPEKILAIIPTFNRKILLPCQRIWKYCQCATLIIYFTINHPDPV